jgi:exopolysaccharide biosynthesis polyprenyl glycosylphosphotransferase
MLKEQAKLLNRIAATTDLLVLASAFIFAYCLRSLGGNLNNFRWYAWILTAVIPLWYFLLNKFGLYDSFRIRTVRQILTDLVKVQIVGGIITASVIYFFEPQGFSRGLFGYFLILSFLFLALEKTVVKIALDRIRRRGYNFRQILVVGTDEKSQEFVRLIGKHAGWGLKIVGLLKLSEEDSHGTVNNYKILGRLDEVVEICKKMPIDEVVFCVPVHALPNVEDYVRDLEEMGVTTRMVLDFYDLQRSKQELSLFQGQIPILTFHCRAFDADHLFLKRCLDIAGAFVGLCVTGLLFPFIALAVKLDSPGPLLFGQKRVGESGRIFTCWKFRSMYVDAERRKQELMHLNEMNGAIFKIKNDPRITRVGALLRKTSLDEFPQFWNVLKGEMSLVGTRPPTPDEVVNYENWHRKRICIKPGITGMWQVSGRNQINDFDEVARLDIEYIETWSLWLDVKILFKTFQAVLTRNGSC